VTVEHLYVHAPFCARRCPYCDFAVTVRRTGGHEAWSEAIRAELDMRENGGPAGDPVTLARPVRTLFVGGGTPSLLGADAMGALGRILGPERVASTTLEWTAEANPESFGPEVARGWQEAGVNRVSLGVQSFDPAVLRWMGRLHGPDGARAAVETARAHGLANLSLDLIFGLPARLGRDLRTDLDAALALDPAHLSLYGLSAEQGTPLARWIREGREIPLDDDAYAEEYLRIAERLASEGYRHYEVSNFARPGFESVHNQAYWSGTPYLGLGNGSHSYLPPFRSWNFRNWDEYSNRVLAGEDPTVERESVEGEARVLETIWLGLRTADGWALPVGTGGDGPESEEMAAAGEIARSWQVRGLAAVRGGRVILTPEGWLLLDELAVQMADVVRTEGRGSG
jgi:oxygen-independent coproporphyrinogen-3 oxidase